MFQLQTDLPDVSMTTSSDCEGMVGKYRRLIDNPINILPLPPISAKWKLVLKLPFQFEKKNHLSIRTHSALYSQSAEDFHLSLLK